MRGLLCIVATLTACKSRQPGDVRLEAQGVLDLAGRVDSALSLHDAVEQGFVEQDVLRAPLPETVRLWRRSKGGDTSCDGEVEEIPLETYVAGVLPHEWIASWDDAALDAGAIAVRTYVSFWSTVGGKYACADLDDTTWSQVYGETRHARTDAAIERTTGQVVALEGALVYAEYSAENSGFTAHGVEDAVCAGKSLDGHGRGLCQWGSQRWATAGKDAAWILEHYYPGATVGPWDALRAPSALEVRFRARQTVRIQRGGEEVLRLWARNTSDEAWEAGSVALVLTDALRSPSETASWESQTVAARNAEVVEPGERVAFELSLRSDYDDRVETFALERADGLRSAQTWRVAVEVTEPRGWMGATGAFVFGGGALGALLGWLGLRVVRRRAL